MAQVRRARCVFTQAFDPNLGGNAVRIAPLGMPRQTGAGWLRALRESAVALLAPGECRLCRLPLVQVNAYPVCEVCMAGLHASAYAACDRCGSALAMESARAAGLSRSDELLCEACTAAVPDFTRAAAFGDYGGSLRTAIHLYKFDGVRSLSRPLGQRLAEAMERVCAGTTETLHVVAVPLFKGKRSFNQSELMAQEAMGLLRLKRPSLHLVAAHDLLQRTRSTASQVHLTPRQRVDNVRGAFAPASRVRGLHVLLVDDVYTTGATAKECTRVLLQAGAASVRVATLARTQYGLAASWEPVARWDGSSPTR